jgi:PTH1 family peptidyl-tRNA hydrolase
VDDINLEPGKLRLRKGGSAGGHNGTQDIIDALGTDNFPRLRIGIGNDFARGRQSDYVLSPFSADEQPLIEEVIATARDAAITFVTDGITTAMNRFN